MANINSVVLIGNLTADPETRHMPQGDNSVTSFTVASQERRRSDDGTFEDGDTTFLRCSAWGTQGLNVQRSLHKGDRVVVVGRVRTSSYEKDGQTRYATEVTVEHVGPALQFATATVLRNTRQSPPGQAPADNVSPITHGRRAAAATPDPMTPAYADATPF